MQVQAMLVEKYRTYFPSPWLQYFTKWGCGMRWCQPDGLLFDFALGTITIVEIKFCHTPLAWFQLYELYLPVVEKIFGTDIWQYRFCELVSWYDVSCRFPGKHYLRKDIHDIPNGEVGVHIWKPNRR